MNYINWLEQKLLAMEPECLICDDIAPNEWCEKHCEYNPKTQMCMNRECLKHAYEVEKGE